MDGLEVNPNQCSARFLQKWATFRVFSIRIINLTIFERHVAAPLRRGPAGATAPGTGEPARVGVAIMVRQAHHMSLMGVMM